MKKQTLFSLIFYIFAQVVSGQNFIRTCGKINDKKSEKAIAYATISIKNQAIGTVTNTEGSFLFHIPVKYKNDSLVVSSIGYESYTIKITDINGKKLNIQLEKKIYDLSEVEIKPKDALEIVKKAIAKIPENYPTQPINMDGFYREMTFENDTCVEMAEAACEFYYRPYEKYNVNKAANKYFSRNSAISKNYFMSNIIFTSSITNPDDLLYVKEARASALHHKYRFKVVPIDGPLSLVGLDIKNWLGINSGSNVLKKNKFTLEKITKYDNKTVYVILAKPKSFKLKKLYESRYYIDIESSAIIALENNWSEYVIKTNKYWSPALYKKKKRKCKDINKLHYKKSLIKYKQSGGKWYLSYIKSEVAFDYIFSKNYVFKPAHNKIGYKLQSELLINNISIKKVEKISDRKSYGYEYMNVICDYDLDYNEKFWENYNVITKTDIQDSIINQLEIKKPLNEQYKNSLVKNDSLPTPRAVKIPFKNPQTHIIDNYYWMQDVKNENLLNYIDTENAYTNNFFIPLKQLKRNLFFEMLHRNERNTLEVGEVLNNGKYIYYYKRGERQNFADLYRKKTFDSKEELILDINKKSRTNENCTIGIISANKENTILSYQEIITGGYDTQTFLMNLNSGENIDSLSHISQIIWKKDGSGLYYLSYNSVNRVDKLFYHKLKSPQKNDILIFEEKNPIKNLFIRIDDNSNYLLIETSDDFGYNKVYLLNQNSNKSEFKNIVNETKGFSHFIKIISDTLYSLTNEPDGKTVLYYTPIDKPEQMYWKKIIQNSGRAFFSGYIILKDYVALLENENMKKRIRVINKQGNTIKLIEFNDEETYSIGFKSKKGLKENVFKYYYTSFTTPEIVFKHNIKTKQNKFIKQDTQIGYNHKDYKSKLLWATSKGGVKVPISIVYNKKRANRNGKSPVLLTAYGSYGSSAMSPTFSTVRLSLLDRGFIYAIAHVRGGGELGAKWHEDAMQMKKKNTFYDFIACAEYLIEKKYTSKGKIVARGGSSGGLTVAVAANWKSDLFNTIILNVPYLDVLNSITDSTAKFNYSEKGELGNPENNEMFKYIKSYSPYDNIKAQNYPNMLFTTGLSDTRVEYWQVVKSVAKLRELKKGNNTLLLKANLHTGHNGHAGYYAYFANTAFTYAFIINNLGIKY